MDGPQGTHLHGKVPQLVLGTQYYVQYTLVKGWAREDKADPGDQCELTAGGAQGRKPKGQQPASKMLLFLLPAAQESTSLELGKGLETSPFYN